MITSASNANITVRRGIDLDVLEADVPHKRVLIVDDEVDTIGLVKQILISAGLDVVSASNGPEAIKRITQSGPDVILLDLMMPGMDGWAVYDQMRKLTNAPVMIISALADTEDIVRGLRIGADDYIAKPFHPSELVARITRVTSQHRQYHLSQIFKFPANALEIDSNTREVRFEGKEIVLPAREFGVLASLARRPGRWVDLATIAFEVWNDSNVHIQSRIKYLVFLLRSQLEKDPGNPRLIVSREGLGYKLAVSPGLENKKEWR
jgi:DNA-binding response OmpR family regulator